MCSLLSKLKSTSLNLFFASLRSRIKAGPEMKGRGCSHLQSQCFFSTTPFKCCGWGMANVEQTNSTPCYKKRKKKKKSASRHKAYSVLSGHFSAVFWQIKGQPDPVPARDEWTEEAQVTGGEKVRVSEWKRDRGGRQGRKGSPGVRAQTVLRRIPDPDPWPKSD